MSNVDGFVNLKCNSTLSAVYSCMTPPPPPPPNHHQLRHTLQVEILVL